MVNDIENYNLHNYIFTQLHTYMITHNTITHLYN